MLLENIYNTGIAHDDRNMMIVICLLCRPQPALATLGMDKLQLTGQNQGRVFHFRYGRVRAVHFRCLVVKLPNLKLKTGPKTSLRFSPVRHRAPRLGQRVTK
jgi:hypothetical protein